MSVQLSTYARNIWLQALADAIDNGTGPGKIRIWWTWIDGLAVDSLGGVVAAELTLSEPCGTVSNGVLTFNPITSGVSDYYISSWSNMTAQIVNGSGTPIIEFRVSDINGNAPIKLQPAPWYEGTPVHLNSLTINGPM
jgi:hypothetical protein